LGSSAENSFYGLKGRFATDKFLTMGLSGDDNVVSGGCSCLGVHFFLGSGFGVRHECGWVQTLASKSRNNGQNSV